jgi:hypothetical protein
MLTYGKVWSNAVDIEGASGDAYVVELGVGQAGGGPHEQLEFLGPRPLLEVSVHLEGAGGGGSRSGGGGLVGGESTPREVQAGTDVRGHEVVLCAFVLSLLALLVLY